MKYIVFALLLFAGLKDFNKISRVNYHKREAEKAIDSEDYMKAINSYKILIDSMQVDDDRLYLNIANAYYQSADTTNAAYYYSRIIDSEDPLLRSQAYQQLGVINQQQNKNEASLQHFKQALKANPSNDQARYNYELLKKIMDQQQQQENQDNQEEQDQEQQDQEKDQNKENQEQQDQQNEENQKQEEQEQQQNEEKGEQEQNQQEESEQQQQQGEEQQQETDEEGEENQMPPSRKEKLEELNLTEEKAKMILEAMKNNELQYLQQMQRKATKKPDSDKPDW
jgi:hypothetical protein